MEYAHLENRAEASGAIRGPLSCIAFAWREVRAGVREQLRFLEAFPKLSFFAPEQRRLLGKLFPNGLPSHLEQSPDVGDCYFVAALYALEQNPMTPYIFADSIVEARHGFSVHFIGADRDEHKIFINDSSDLEGQEILDKKGLRKHKQSINGQLGDIILERAFARQRKERKARDAHQVDPQESFKTMSVVEGGYCGEPLKMFLGEKAEILSIGGYEPFVHNFRDKRDAENLLMQFGMRPYRFIVTACTPSRHTTKYFFDGEHREFGKGRNYFMDPEYFFYQGHAFAIISVDPAAKTVTIVNPHNTQQFQKTISFNNFFQYFSRVEAAKLNETVEDRRIKKVREMMQRQTDAACLLASHFFPGRSFAVSRVNDSIFNLTENGRYAGYSFMISMDKFSDEVGGRVQLIKMEKQDDSWRGVIVNSF